MRGLAIVLMIAVASTAASKDQFAVYRSEDQGRTWDKSDVGLPGNSRVNAFVSIGESIVAGVDRGIFISSDKGRSWKPAESFVSDVGRIVCLATSGNSLWAGTDEGFLLVSFDAGKTWKRNATFPVARIRSLHTVGDDVYVGTNADHVFRSMDHGKTWAHLSSGLPTGAQVFAITSIGARVFAGLYSKGLFAWDNSDQRWRQLGELQKIRPLALASMHNTLLAGHNAGGIYISDDFGQSWKHWSLPPATLGIFQENLPSSPQAPIWAMGADTNLGIAGAADSILISRNRGADWARATEGLPSNSPGIAFLAGGNVILAAIHKDQ